MFDFIKKFKPKNVLIHDAARPDFSSKLLVNLINSLKKNKASIPVISSKDSIKYKIKDQIFNLNKKYSYLAQTPQAFRFNIFLISNFIIKIFALYKFYFKVIFYK